MRNPCRNFAARNRNVTWPSQQAIYFIRCYTELNSEAVLRLVQCILQMRNLGFGLAHQSFGLTHIKLITSRQI